MTRSRPGPRPEGVPADLRIALVHDWLTGMRGGERVLEIVCELFPQASLYTLLYIPGSVSPAIARLSPRSSFVQHLPLARRFYRHYLPLFPIAVEQFNLDAYDLVISLSHCVAKSAVTLPHTRHLCYCFTPMRYAWDQFDAYFGTARLGMASHALRPVLQALARWDAATSGRPDRYLAISQHVAQRIGRYYNRVASIVHPPVDTAFYTPLASSPEPYFLIVSALVPYKRIDMAIAAARRSALTLKIVGDGPERAALEASAPPNVEFLGRKTDEEVRDLYRHATAVLLPGVEDFGIVPLEAQACGRPVVALAAGGALETVIDGETGVLVPEDTEAAWVDALDRVQRLQVDPARLQSHVDTFARPRFEAAFVRAVTDLLSAPAGTIRW